MVWSVGRGCPLPTEEGSGEGSVSAPQNLKKNFGSMCSKNFCVQAKGGGHRPMPLPLNTPLILTVYVTNCYLASSSSFDNTLDVTSCVCFHVHA